MTKEQAFQILVSIFPTLKLNEEERQTILKAYKVIEEELGLKVKENKEENRKSRRNKK